MAVGASLMWRTPWVDLPSMSTGILVTYAATAGVVWLAGIQALIAPHAAHASMPAWAPAGWAFMHFAWPGVAATSMAYAVGAGDLGLAAQSACLLAALCLSAAALATLTRVGVALTMQPPWPGDAPLPPAFSGVRSLPAWVALLATAALNLLIVQGPVRLLGA